MTKTHFRRAIIVPKSSSMEIRSASDDQPKTWRLTMSEFPTMTVSPARAEAFFETMNTTRPRAKRHGSAVLALAAALAVAAYVGGAAAQARSVGGGMNLASGAAPAAAPLAGRPSAVPTAEPPAR